jgi:hypothetical protein
VLVEEDEIEEKPVELSVSEEEEAESGVTKVDRGDFFLIISFYQQS